MDVIPWAAYNRGHRPEVMLPATFHLIRRCNSWSSSASGSALDVAACIPVPPVISEKLPCLSAEMNNPLVFDDVPVLWRELCLI